MIVSGGKILAIGKVNVGTGLSGDGVTYPIGLTSELPIVSSYDISAGQNVFVERIEGDSNDITFLISANGGGSSTSDLKAGNYIDITNDFINVDGDLINSASSGYSALYLIQNNSSVWNKDWNNEIETAVTGKLDKTIFADYSANISSWQNDIEGNIDDTNINVDDISAYIEEHETEWISDLKAGNYIDITNDFINVDGDLINSASSGYSALELIQNNSSVWNKDWNNEIETAVTGKLDKTVFVDYSANISSWQNDIEGNIDDTNINVDDISAYIEEHETEWILSGVDVEMETLSPDNLTIESANVGVNGVKFSISAINPTKYSAGDWIDSENLDAGTISVSGHRGIFLNDPLYWTSADIDGSIRYYINVSDHSNSAYEYNDVYAKVTGDHVTSNYLGTRTDNITYNNNTRTFDIDSLANLTIMVNYNLHLSPTAHDLAGPANLIVGDELVSKNIFGFLGEENINASFYKSGVDEVKLETYFDSDVVNSYDFTATIFGSINI